MSWHWTDERHCWKCGSPETFIDGGHDDAGNPITTCSDCGERQEEE